MVNIPRVQQLKCDYQLGADAYLVQEKKLPSETMGDLKHYIMLIMQKHPSLIMKHNRTNVC